MSYCSRRWATSLVGLAVALLTVSAAWLEWQPWQGALADDLPAPEAVRTSSAVDPTRVEGHEKCIDCHAQEVRAWQASKHATRAFDLLRTSPTSREYAQQLGIRPADIARDSLCVTCHATPRQVDANHATVISGVSCEACHNGSGGADGWLNLHASYGPRGTRREDETPEHYAQRQANCDQAGQFRSNNAYHLVKRCFACHVVGNEALAEAGHDHGEGFEVLEAMLGEIRHNFFLDRSQNAELATLWTDSLHHKGTRNVEGRKRVLFLVGQLVDLETSLQSLATATDDNDLVELMVDRINEAYELLVDDLLDNLEDVELPEIEGVVELVEPVYEKLDEDGFLPEDRALYRETADGVAQVARKFGTRDGSKLVAIEAFEDLLPEGPFDGVYQPGAVREPGRLP